MITRERIEELHENVENIYAIHNNQVVLIDLSDPFWFGYEDDFYCTDVEGHRIELRDLFEFEDEAKVELKKRQHKTTS